MRLRAARTAHPQIRELSIMILKEFIKRFPVFFQDLKPLTEEV